MEVPETVVVGAVAVVTSEDPRTDVPEVPELEAWVPNWYAPMTQAPELGRELPSKSSSPTPKLVRFTPAPMAAEAAWRWRS